MAKLVIELKKDANAELILNYLLKNTDLQVNYNFNMVAIVNRRPKQIGILEILDAFITHQKDVILRRTNFDLGKAQERLHIVDGFLKAVDIIDEIIKIIRSSKNKQESIDNLVKKFEFTVEQATAIVMMRLYSLSNTDVNLLLEEQDNLRKMIEFLNSILNDETVLKKQRKNSLNEIKKNFGNPRRTEIRDEVTDIKIDMKEMIQKENVIVAVTSEGYVKRIPLKSYVAANGEPTTLKPGDHIEGLYSTTTLDTLLLFTNQGQYLYVPIHEIVESKWKELGKHISNLIPLAPEEKIISSMILDDPKEYVIMTTKQGVSKRTQLEELIVSRYTKTINAMKLKDGDEMVSAVKDNGRAIFVTKNGYYLNIKSDEIPIVGSKASGVRGINVKDDEVVTCISPSLDKDYILIATNKSTAKRVRINELELSSRAKKGSTLIKKVKTNPYEIINVIPVSIQNTIGVKIENEIDEIKVTEIGIMDLSSTGSSISKHQIEEAFIMAEIIECKLEEQKEPKKEPEDEKIELPKKKTEAQELTIEDFIEDFKL